MLISSCGCSAGKTISSAEMPCVDKILSRIVYSVSVELNSSFTVLSARVLNWRYIFRTKLFWCGTFTF
jgi:hypothetical protein